MKNYSIIIPVRNHPELLRRCLDSIPRREDVEIIVVDDHSDPREMDFGHYPGEGEECVTLLRNEGQAGAGVARNLGISHATGRWILFLDSDDFFTPSFGQLADSHLEDDADIVFFNVTSVHSEDLTPSDRHLGRSVFFTRYTGARREFCCRYLYCEPWGKMFRTSFLRLGSFRFDSTPVANDFYFSAATGLAAGKVRTDSRVIYCLTERKGSLSNEFVSTPEQLRARLDVYQRVQSLLLEAKVRCYPFNRLVKYVISHNPGLIPVLKEFCAEKGLDYKRTVLRTKALASAFAFWHRSWWAVF